MERPVCACGLRLIEKGYKICWKCRRPNLKNPRHRRRQRLLAACKQCPECGFVPKHECQLEIDHIDGNSKNNKAENLQVLCSCCHRLKTFNAGDIPDWHP